MLVQFKFGNYRSFRDPQELSLAASTSISDDRNAFDVTLRGHSSSLLRCAAVVGANASGKSSLISALSTMRKIVRSSATSAQADAPLPVVPFLLDPKFAKAPTLFEVTFILDKVLYQYGFEATTARVVREWLLAFPEGRKQTWIQREEGHVTTFGRGLEGPKRDIEKLTRPNGLLLSFGAQFNNQQLTHIYNWISTSLRSLKLGTNPFSSEGYTTNRIAKDEHLRTYVRKMMALADLGILDVNAELRSMTVEDIDVDRDMPAEVRQELARQLQDQKMVRALFTHRGVADNVAQFGIPDESDGTRKMFGLLGPWDDSLRGGHALFVDELSASLHPLLSRRLVAMFNDPIENKNNGQLVFTTHDATLLDLELLRRDQVWLCEKDECGASSLVPLLRYRPRSDEALQRGYLAGRYGAVPIIEDTSH